MHVNVQYHFTQEKLKMGVISLNYCSTEHIVVNVLIRALARDRHVKFMTAIGLKIFG